LSTRDKLREIADIVKENLKKVQGKQKQQYDKNARLREFTPGDPVLVLLPTSTSKLLAQWQGPYQVLKRVGRVSYLVDMRDKRKRKRIFHVNMLKEFHVHRPAETGYWMEEVQEDDSDIPMWNDNPQGEFKIEAQLTQSQKEQL
jgi:ribosomal protein L21E